MKKKFKPVYTVDVTNCTDERGIIVAFVEAKVKAGLPITEEELNAVIFDYSTDAAEYTTYLLTSMIPIKIEYKNTSKVDKKPNVFKRFWNWITRKK